MKGLILTNAFYESDSVNYQTSRLKDEFELLGVSIDIKKNNQIISYINNNTINTLANDYAFCIYLDKDKYISDMLDKSSIKVFNNPKSIEICDDKMKTYIQLANCGINMPVTISGLLSYRANNVDHSFLNSIANILGFPLIIKTCYGSLGEGVYKANTLNNMIDITTQLATTPHIFQQYIGNKIGQDIRVIVVGNQPICAMLRQSNNDFRSNIELGGSSTPLEITPQIATLCQQITQILNLDYCGIDFLIGQDNQLIVCEVNSNAFFRAIENTCRINVAKAYCHFIINKLK